jgi:proline dehydrogenase
MVEISNVLRAVLLKISTLSVLKHIFEHQPFSQIPKRFIAGESINDAIKTATTLSKKKFHSTIDFLGEEVKSPQKVNEAVKCYLKILDEIHRLTLPANISIKLSHFGITFNENLCLNSTLQLVTHAKEIKNFVRIDMEGSNLLDKTIQIFKKLTAEYFGVGIVIQAYLLKAEEIADDAIKNLYSVRLCKGAYKEPSHIAYQKKKEINNNYLKIAVSFLRHAQKYYEKFNSNGPQFCGIGFATHDHTLIQAIIEFAKDNKIPKNYFEFQMLYGIRPRLQSELIEKDFNVRLYIPFGKEWFGYTLRRMAERPANFIFVVRNIFK